MSMCGSGGGPDLFERKAAIAETLDELREALVRCHSGEATDAVTVVVSAMVTIMAEAEFVLDSTLHVTEAHRQLGRRVASCWRTTHRLTSRRVDDAPSDELELLAMDAVVQLLDLGRELSARLQGLS